jgi:hypothetical protein
VGLRWKVGANAIAPSGSAVGLLLEREWRAEWEGMDTNEGINRLENLFYVSGKSASSAD